VRITCDATDRGNVYRFHRTDASFFLELKKMATFLMEADVPLELGGSDGDAHVLLTAGPLRGRQEDEFRKMVKQYLDARSLPGKASCAGE